MRVRYTPPASKRPGKMRFAYILRVVDWPAGEANPTAVARGSRGSRGDGTVDVEATPGDVVIYGVMPLHMRKGASGGVQFRGEPGFSRFGVVKADGTILGPIVPVQARDWWISKQTRATTISGLARD